MSTPEMSAGLPYIAAPIRRGIERETLRANAQGELSLAPHPNALGSKLGHPHITTDFSEAQLELITGVSATPEALLGELAEIHSCVYAGLGAELLWPTSMPCELPADDAIPLAHYGTSNAARTKTIYRKGLAIRYGRAMQTICAVHYNLSFSDELFDALAERQGVINSQGWRDTQYFNLMRNFRANSWLVVYLFGASPAVSDSFVVGREHNFSRLGRDTLYLPHATSLRSGALGYQSDVQAENLLVTYNTLNDYVASLAGAITKPWPGYAENEEGEPIQLNRCILQSEAEFYSSIRAKRMGAGFHSGLAALAAGGVEYIEVRLLDIDPLAPLGISKETLAFMDAFLTWCLLTPATNHDSARCAEIRANIRTTVHRGREPGLVLQRGGDPCTLQSWGTELIDALAPAAGWLDSNRGDDLHTAALATQRARIDNPANTPSAHVEEALTAGASFNSYGLELAQAHRDKLQTTLDDEVQRRFDALARESLATQARADAAAEPSFTDHLDGLQRGYAAILRAVGSA